MADSIRFHARDTLYALICRYFITGTRDVSNFTSNLAEKYRKINVDGTDFKIVRTVPTQSLEKPGVNIVFYDDHRTEPYVGGDRRVAAVAIHIYKPTTTEVIKDERTVLKLVRKVDEALYGCGVGIYNFDVTPAIDLGPALFWRPMKYPESWLNKTNLSQEPNIHYARNFSVSWDEKSIS